MKTFESFNNVIDFAQDVQMGIENADYDTTRRLLEILEVKVFTKERGFYITSLVGRREGKIRKIKLGEKVGIVNASH